MKKMSDVKESKEVVENSILAFVRLSEKSCAHVIRCCVDENHREYVEVYPTKKKAIDAAMKLFNERYYMGLDYMIYQVYDEYGCLDNYMIYADNGWEGEYEQLH